MSRVSSSHRVNTSECATFANYHWSVVRLLVREAGLGGRLRSNELADMETFPARASLLHSYHELYMKAKVRLRTRDSSPRLPRSLTCLVFHRVTSSRQVSIANEVQARPEGWRDRRVARD